jgi:hypothetical protein
MPQTGQIPPQQTLTLCVALLSRRPIHVDEQATSPLFALSHTVKVRRAHSFVWAGLACRAPTLTRVQNPAPRGRRDLRLRSGAGLCNASRSVGNVARASSPTSGWGAHASVSRPSRMTNSPRPGLGNCSCRSKSARKSAGGNDAARHSRSHEVTAYAAHTCARLMRGALA